MNDAKPPRRFRAETRAAASAVAQALALARRGQRSPHISAKGAGDIVTDVDLASEDLIRERLVGAFGLPVVGEERGGVPPADGSAYWLVDPLCGTRNFAAGMPLYSINVTLVEGGRVTIGVVGEAASGDIVMAEVGGGAWSRAPAGGEPHPVRVSDHSRMIVVEDGASAGERREHAARFM